MDALTDYLAGFGEDPGYLDFAVVRAALRPPSSRSPRRSRTLVRRARWGAGDRLEGNVGRLRDAVAVLTGFRSDQIVFQPSTGQGITQAVYGLAGGVLVSRGRVPVPADRGRPRLRGPAGRHPDLARGATAAASRPGGIREALTSTTMAVLVSAVDARTGAVADLDGIRQVIGDRLLIVDAVQAVGAVDLPWDAADVVACGGQKWLRAG